MYKFVDQLVIECEDFIQDHLRGFVLLSSTIPDMSSAVRKSGTPANFSPVVNASSKFFFLSPGDSVLRDLKSNALGKKL